MSESVASDDDITNSGKNTIDDKILSKLNTIWEDPYVQKIYDDKQKPRWKCGWCGQTGGGHNATKVLWHIAKIRGKDVTICKAKQDPHYEERYKTMAETLNQKRSAKRKTMDESERLISSRQSQLTDCLIATKMAKKANVPTPSSNINTSKIL